MAKKTKRALTATLCLILLLSGIAACSSTPAATGTPQAQTQTQQPAAQTTEPTTAPTAKPVVTVDTATDSSELPDWTGEQLKLVYWYAHGTGGAVRTVSPNDVVSPEIKRIFGIELDRDNSFDNGGQDQPSKLAVLAASGDWPDIGYNAISDELIQGDKVYDLTDLLPKYAPHLYKWLQDYSPKGLAKGYNGTGKMYSVPVKYNNDVTSMKLFYPDLDIEKYQYLAAPMDAQGWSANLWVRDDILKLAYPNAKSQKEIEDLYVKNGKFTRDDVYDVKITTKQEAIDFFYNIAKAIKDNNITESGKPVYATAVFSGQDNWALAAWLNNLVEGVPNFNYFTFFNPQTKKIELGYNQPWFKDDMLLYNKFVRDGVAPESSLIENNEIYTNKLNNGEYAISYAWLAPDNAKIEAAGKPWRFRKVYFDIPQDLTKYIWNSSEPGGVGGLCIFKDKVKPEQVPQILSWLDFMYTPVGMKLACWGPKTAGLWDETNGVRKFTNKEVEDALVYGIANGAEAKYNLINPSVDTASASPAWPEIMPVGVKCGGIYNPRYVYDMMSAERKPTSANQFFATGVFGQPVMTKQTVVTTCDIWNFTNEVPAIKSFWDVRGTGFEPLMTKIFAAKSDADFDKAYAAMVDFASKNGLNDAACADAQKLMQDKYTADWNAYLAGTN